jgi:hypothetical protein
VALQLLRMKPMNRLAVTLALVWVLILLAVAAIPAVWEPDADSQKFMEPQPAGFRLDLFGNEVSDAVGDYRIDRRGEVYEWHSPDTAVLRLRPAGV